MKKKKNIILLTILIILLFIVNYGFIDSWLIKVFDDSEYFVVERVIDGDTIIAGGERIRLLGINSPERGEKYYSESKEFLEDLVLNKSVKLEYGINKKDKYNRLLAYIFIRGKNINLELVENGFANPYFLNGKTRYYDEFYSAWMECVDEEKNLCEGSKDKCANCILLKEFNVKEQRIVFKNICNFDCDLTNWDIKDEGRKNFIFSKFILEFGEEIKIVVGKGKDSGDILFWKNQDYVWTKKGDTLFLRDSIGNLVLWRSY